MSDRHEKRRREVIDDPSLRRYGKIEHRGYVLDILGTESKAGYPRIRLALQMPTSGAFCYLDLEASTLDVALPTIIEAVTRELDAFEARTGRRLG